MAQCRDDKCLMSFSTERHRNSHENLMHKNLLNDAVVRMVDRIILSNTSEKTSKKLIKTNQGNFSYNEAKDFLCKDTPEQKAIKSVLQPIVEMMFEANPDWTLRELLSIPDYKL